MALTFAQMNVLARDADFRMQVTYAAVSVAMDVLEEAANAGDETTARQSLARRVLNANGDTETDKLARALSTQSPYQAGSAQLTDTAVLTFVTNNWSRLAGYNPNITP